jgi:NADH-ubiquinone oxidoreductase chain 5
MSFLPKKIYIFLNKKWLFDQIFNEFLVLKLLNFGYGTTFLALDKGLIERIGPSGFTAVIFYSTFNSVKLNSGLFFKVIIVFLLFASFFLGFFLLRSTELFLLTNFGFFLLIGSYFSFIFFNEIFL